MTKSLILNASSFTIKWNALSCLHAFIIMYSAEAFILQSGLQQRTSTLLFESKNSTDVFYSPNMPLEDFRSSDKTPSDAAQGDTTNEYSFFDEAVIYVRAGSGGQGSSTYKKAVGGQNGPPDGGNGGNGGNVILQVDISLNTLAGLTAAWRPNSFGGSGGAATMTTNVRPKSFRAENGADGARQFKNGAYGKDTIIRVPPGTVVQEQIETEQGETRYFDIGSLTEEDEETLLVASGGQGGEGTGVQGRARGVRRPRVPSTGGQRKLIKLTLKIVADGTSEHCSRHCALLIDTHTSPPQSPWWECRMQVKFSRRCLCMLET